MLMLDIEEVTLDINPTSLTNPRTRQPCSLVPSRSLETRLHPQYRRRRNRHRSPPRLEPRYDAFPRLRRKLHNAISTLS